MWYPLSAPATDLISEHTHRSHLKHLNIHYLLLNRTMAVKKNGDEVGNNASSPTMKKVKSPRIKTPKSDKKETPKSDKKETPKSDKKEKSSSKVTPERRKQRSSSTDGTVSIGDEDVETKVESVSKKLEMESPKRRKRSQSVVDEPVVPEVSDEPVQEPEEEEEDTVVTKPPPVLNTRVHRMRHLNFQPKAIICMSSTPHHAQACDYVAVSHEGGGVALKSPDEKWRTLVSIAGMRSKTVDTMAWICGACDQPATTTSFTSEFHKSHTDIQSQRTLVGASKDGTVFVIDFAKACYSAITGSGGGGVFALTSLCGSKCCTPGTCPGLVAAGCEDGSVKIYKLKRVNGNHRLDLVSMVPAVGAAVLSLAWIRHGENSGHGMGGTVLYTGIADGTIRRYECKSAIDQARSKGSIIDSELEYGKQTWSSKTRMTVESLGRTNPTRIWAVKALADGTVVSGDSLGHVQFWDGRTGTLMHSFDQNDQKADILALAVTSDERKVFASGIDSRVICIERSTFHDGQGGPARWIMTHAQRPHTHDVKALVICHVHSTSGALTRSEKPFLTLCSGGVDTKICTILAEKFKNGRPRVWLPWPTFSPISVAKEARILLLQREETIELHRLGAQQTDSLPLILDEEKQFVGRMDIKGSHNLVCSDISNDGKYLILSTGSTLLLFEIAYIENVDGTLGFTPKQIILANETKQPFVAVKFVSAATIICADSNGFMRLLKLSREANGNSAKIKTKVVIASQVDSSTIADESPSNVFAIHSLVTSDDGQFFATVRGGVGSGTVCVYSITDESIHHHWSVSAMEAPVSSVGFLPGRRRQLVVACSNYAMYIFDLKERKLSKWSEKNGFPVSPTLPEELDRPYDFPKCVMSSALSPGKFLLVS
jgi:U3 small nucleolar RNA-associated protein 4